MDEPNIVFFDKELIKRFFNKIDKSQNCWNWKGGSRGNGYGAIKVNGKVIDTHRFSWMIHFGEIPKNIFVCHKCDNRKCVNPEHLFLGTNSDNMKDCFNKGRLKIPTTSQFKKKSVPKNKRIKHEREILQLKEAIYKRNCSLSELSKSLNLPISLLKDISCGRIYK